MLMNILKVVGVEVALVGLGETFERKGKEG